MLFREKRDAPLHTRRHRLSSKAPLLPLSPFSSPPTSPVLRSPTTFLRRARRAFRLNTLGTAAAVCAFAVVCVACAGVLAFAARAAYGQHVGFAQAVFAPPMVPLPQAVEGRVQPFEVGLLGNGTDGGREEAQERVKVVQAEMDARLLALGLPRSTALPCADIPSSASLAARYSPLRGLSPSRSARTGPTFLALNLYNSASVLPSLSRTLLSLAAFLGPQTVHVSIFENGSTDETPLALAHLAAALTALGTPHTIVSDECRTDWKRVDRIAQLAVYRNVAMEPLPQDAEDVLWINDVFVCPADVLELLRERREQSADAACAMDWRETRRLGLMRPGIKFYDSWVARSLTGRLLRPRFDLLGSWRDGIAELFTSSHGEDSWAGERFRAGLAVPVYSCWNGMVAFTAAPFLDGGIAPRYATTNANTSATEGEGENWDRSPPLPSWDGDGPTRFRSALWSEEGCAASECKALAYDLWTRGFDRWIIVPTVRATYALSTYTHPSLVALSSLRSLPSPSFSSSSSPTSPASPASSPGPPLDSDSTAANPSPFALSSSTQHAATSTAFTPLIPWASLTPPSRVVCYPWTRGWQLDMEGWAAVWRAPFAAAGRAAAVVVVPQQEADLELQPLPQPHELAPPPSPPRSTPRTRRVAALAHAQEQAARNGSGTMKFSHSLLFNAVPEWTNHYLAYDSLKAQIYKFEKQAVLQLQSSGQLANGYRDDEEAAAGDGAGEGSKEANERVFVRLLEKELEKITEFYVDKERELLGDLVLLKEDLDRMRQQEEEDYSSGAEDGPGGAGSRGRARGRRLSGARGSGSSGPRATSGMSDSDEELEELEDEDDTRTRTVEQRTKGAFERAFASPKEYGEASRVGRKAAVGGGGKKAKRGAAAAGAGEAETGDLLGLSLDDHAHAQEADEDAAAPLSPSSPSQPSGRRRSLASAAAPPPPRGGARPSVSRRALSRLSNSILSASAHEQAVEDDLAGAWAGLTDWQVDARIMHKRRLAGLFTSLSELKQYVDLNYTGLSKVLKKYDKITNSSLRQPYMTTVVDRTFPFEPATRERLQAGIASLIPLYADLATGGDVDLALKQLKAHLREHVVWERNTVWREMIGLERRGWGGAAGGSGARRGASGGGGMGTDLPLVQPASPPPGEEAKANELRTPVGRLRLPRWVNAQTVPGALAVLVFFAVLNANWLDRVEEQNCLALLCVVTIFWALEIVPLFVTALLVPFLVVVLRVIRSTDGEDRRLTSPEATKYIFGQMFSPTIMLLLGGFTLAAALSKQNIDKVLATKVLSFAGTRPRTVLFSYMLVACFASMWISNVAAPVLCYSLIQPILRTLPSKSPFSKALILGIALASNIGGMASPISSPQNLIALEYMNPPLSWLAWFAVSIPVSFLSVCLIWGMLLYAYRAGSSSVVINPVRVNKEPFTREQWFVSVVTMATIALWCVESRLSWLFGDMGIIAVIPIALFYGTGVLRKADFDHSPWSIVFLAMGGIGLGKAVLSSGLLDDIDGVIEHLVMGWDLWPILALFSMISLVIATFISHTVAAVLVVPVAAQIGLAMDSPHPRLLIFAIGLVCSAGMGLPISGFPNLQAINVEDELGQRYLQPSDFFKVGIPASVAATAVIITVGYTVMRAMGL
ncbi:hypothetical protein JCM10213_008594 [Rhodosporidiobolus nylandii]